MDFNSEKYFVENSDALTEAEKIQFAKDLIELERQGVVEYRGGRWRLAAGVKIEETPEGSVMRSSDPKFTGPSVIGSDIKENHHERRNTQSSSRGRKQGKLV